jgi:hypothetical protein
MANQAECVILFKESTQSNKVGAEVDFIGLTRA